MATALAVIEGQKPSQIESDVLNAVDVRERLQEAIEEQERKRVDAEHELAKTFAAEVVAPNFNVAEAAFQRHGAWKAADEQIQQRIEALQSILDKVDKHFEQLTSTQPEAVKVALTNLLEKLKKTLAEEGESQKELKYQIERLQAEINKLPKAAKKSMKAAKK